MKLRRSAVLSVLTLAALGIAAAPAGAVQAPIIAGGSFAKTIPFIDGQLYEYECHALAPGAVSTSITRCQLSGLETVAAPPASSQGPVAVTDGGVSWDATTSQVCWTATARYSDGSTQSTSGCSTASPDAGTGVS